MAIVIPATGAAGTSNPPVATEVIGGDHYQSVKANDPQAYTPSVTSVPVSTSSAQFFASSTGPLSRLVHNDVQSGILFLKFGSNPTTCSYTAQLPKGAYYELPRPLYLGTVTGLWQTTSTAGSAMATEVQA